MELNGGIEPPTY